MKTSIHILFLLFLSNLLSAQYYIRGDVKDENGNFLQNVKIWFPKSNLVYYSGVSGGFGIPSSHLTDSMVFSKNDYVTESLEVNTTKYVSIKLKMTAAKANLNSSKLVSFTEGVTAYIPSLIEYKGETYNNLLENEYVKTNKDSKTTFSMRIDKASYSNIRRFLNQDEKVPPEAVRIEEMLNYFNLNYKEPPEGKIFNIQSRLSDCPWNETHKLLFVNISAKKLNLDTVPPSNFIFLIDVSGSMDLPNRLPLLKEAFQLLVKNLREKDRVSIVIYGNTVSLWLPSTSGAEKDKIIESIEKLKAAGDTPGEAALRTAYDVARRTFIPHGNNRIIMATDGDFNVGQRSEKDLEDLIAGQKKNSIYLTCLGVGMGNYKDSKIEVLAKKGNGNFAYIDNINEAEKVLVTEFTQTAYSVAGDVRLSLKFNAALVSEYRLLGYDNKISSLEKKATELEGGEIGSGSGSMVIFEIVPTEGNLIDLPLAKPASLILEYRSKDDSLHVLPQECIVSNSPFKLLPKEIQFGTAVTMFGLKLKESSYFPDVTWQQIHKIGSRSYNEDNYLQSEFLDLVDRAEKVYSIPKTKKKRRFF
ncbi:MAG: von Willebrand factor type A domain-containing protein [Ginsengibacter sp.]